MLFQIRDYLKQKNPWSFWKKKAQSVQSVSQKISSCLIGQNPSGRLCIVLSSFLTREQPRLGCLLGKEEYYLSDGIWASAICHRPNEISGVVYWYVIVVFGSKHQGRARLNDWAGILISLVLSRSLPWGVRGWLMVAEEKVWAKTSLTFASCYCFWKHSFNSLQNFFGRQMPLTSYSSFTNALWLLW